MSVLIYVGHHGGSTLLPAPLEAEAMCLPPAELIDIEEIPYAG